MGMRVAKMLLCDKVFPVNRDTLKIPTAASVIISANLFAVALNKNPYLTLRHFAGYFVFGLLLLQTLPGEYGGWCFVGAYCLCHCSAVFRAQ
jgi:hypothetical protein